jgi:hypothetical protein
MSVGDRTMQPTTGAGTGIALRLAATGGFAVMSLFVRLASFEANALLSASPSPRHDMLVVGKMMAGDWGWRKERYPFYALIPMFAMLVLTYRLFVGSDTALAQMQELGTVLADGRGVRNLAFSRARP